MQEYSKVSRLTRKARQTAALLSDAEARFMVGGYYTMQENRIRSNQQADALSNERPRGNWLVQWLAEQREILETQIKGALDVYTDNQAIGRWSKSIHGIGPVIAAGLLAHIDIRRADSVGKIWRFAGLDPTVRWGKGQKRPWNPALKVLSWKMGQSFMKHAAHEDCFYGHIYRERKAYEVERNDRGINAVRAREILAEKRFAKTTDAYRHLTGGKLPPAQIDAMARRHAVKLFLSHFHLVWHWLEFGRLPPSPYAVAILGHKDFLPPPNIGGVPGLADALRHGLH